MGYDNEKNKKKIAILFGAGAEIDLGIPGGQEFSKAVLGLENSAGAGSDISDIKKAVDTYYQKKFPRNDKKEKWYPDHAKHDFLENDLLSASLERKYYEENESFETKGSYDEQVKKEFERLRFKKGEQDTEERKKERWEIIEEYTSYMGILDKNFYTLIEPKCLGPINFWKVIDCYTRAYLAVVSSLLKPEERGYEKYKTMLNDPVQTYEDVIRAIQDKKEKYSYYRILREKKEICSVVTTNYTPLCKVISGLGEEDIAYVHGRIDWFENPRTSQVYDIQEIKEMQENEIVQKDLLFPYIFLQSGVKPIVERRQIEEYHKMVKFLERAERIVVLGYNINCDDNHVNGMLHFCVQQGKEVVYLDYKKSSLTENRRQKLLNKLRLDASTAEYKNFIYQSIDEKDCYEIFQKYLSL